MGIRGIILHRLTIKVWKYDKYSGICFRCGWQGVRDRRWLRVTHRMPSGRGGGAGGRTWFVPKAASEESARRSAQVLTTRRAYCQNQTAQSLITCFSCGGLLYQNFPPSVSSRSAANWPTRLFFRTEPKPDSGWHIRCKNRFHCIVRRFELRWSSVSALGVALASVDGWRDLFRLAQVCRSVLVAFAIATRI